MDFVNLFHVVDCDDFVHSTGCGNKKDPLRLRKMHYRCSGSANAVVGKIGGRSSEDVILQLIHSKCMPALLYGVEACPLRLSANNSLDFVINRFFMTLFKTNNLETVTYCHMQFNFDLPSTILKKRSDVFARKYGLCNNVFYTLVVNLA